MVAIGSLWDARRMASFAVARGDRGDECVGIALTLTHTGIERLLGERLDREDSDPYLAFTVHATGDSLTGRLNLLRGDPAILEGLETEGTERELIAPLGHTLHHVLLFPSELGFLWL